MEARLRSKALHKVTVSFLRVIPALMALCDLVNTTMDFAGIDCWFLSFIGGVSLLPLLFLYAASYLFGFCTYHRMFLNYVLASNIISTIDMTIGIPVDNLQLVVLHLVVLGIFTFLVVHYYRKEA